jgi:tetratricopeptide (TPR) repeat protein
VLVTACQEPEHVVARKPTVAAGELVAQAKAEQAKGHPEKALPLLKQAVAERSDVPTLMRLADAYAAVGNEPAALLTLKQAEEKSGGHDPGFKRARAELYVKMHDEADAIVELQSLLELDLLTDHEVQVLAQLLGHAGRLPEAFTTLDHVLKRSPDDEPTKVVEAELLLARHDDQLAVRLLDELLKKNPSLTTARVLHARVVRASGQAERALDELKLVPADQATSVELVTLEIELLNQLHRSDQALVLAQRLVDETPKAADPLALLAETRLLLGDAEQAQVLVEQALSIEPRWPRALTVRGQALETLHRPDEAMLEYRAALEADPAYAPALSRVWRVELARDAHQDALSTLEHLDAVAALAADEKLALVRLSVEAGSNPTRAAALVDELLVHEPKNAELLTLKSKVARSQQPAKAVKAPGIIIIKGKR